MDTTMQNSQSYRNAEGKESPPKRTAQTHGLSLGEKHSNTKPHCRCDQSRAVSYRSTIEPLRLKRSGSLIGFHVTSFLVSGGTAKFSCSAHPLLLKMGFLPDAVLPQI